MATNGPTASTDTAGPAILTISASDETNVIEGIDNDDTVTITFSEDTNQPDINSGNIDMVMDLSNNHVWVDGSSQITSANWSSASVLVVTLSTNTYDPTVALSDTITLNGSTITDGTTGSSIATSPAIAGSFITPTIQFTNLSSNGAESSATPNLELSLSSSIDSDVTVNYTVSGTATGSSTDYALAAGTATITAGNTSTNITPGIVNDTLDEEDETIIVTIASPNNAVLGGNTTHTYTITDDDEAPTVTLTIDNSSIAEAAGESIVTATLSDTSGKTVTTSLIISGTATDTDDYSNTTSSIVIAAGNTSGTTTITGTSDSLDEEDETVIIDIDTVTNGTENATQQQTITILDDDEAPTVTLSVDNAELSEAAGTSTVTATLSGASGKTVTTDLVFSGTATNASDYSNSGSSIVILAGNTSGSIILTGIDDNPDEIDETVIVDIDTVTNGTENATQQQTVTVIDDDPEPTVSLSVNKNSLNERSGGLTATISLSEISTKDVTINLTFLGSAANGSDFTPSSSSVTIPAGSTTDTISISTINNSEYEESEYFTIGVSSITNGTESGTIGEVITINDDDDSGAGASVAAVYRNSRITTIAKTPTKTTKKTVSEKKVAKKEIKPVEKKKKADYKKKVAKKVIKPIITDNKKKVAVKPVEKERTINEKHEGNYKETAPKKKAKKPQEKKVEKKVAKIDSLSKKVTKTLAFEFSGKIGEEVSLQDPDSKAFMTIDKENLVTFEKYKVIGPEGEVILEEAKDELKPFKGDLSAPKTASKDEKKETEKSIPKGKKMISEIYKMGPQDANAKIKFNKKITIALPIEINEEDFKSDEFNYIAHTEEVLEIPDALGEGKRKETNLEYGEKCDIKKLNDQFFCEFETKELKTYTVLKEENPYKDIKGHWAKDYIVELHGKKALNNTKEFEPNKKMNRAEFTKVVLKSLKYTVPEETKKAPFRDLDPKDEATPYIVEAFENKLIKGFARSEFKPKNPVSRAEALKILFEASNIDTKTKFVSKYSDVDQDQWYAEYINYATKEGIIKGYADGSFNPNGPITNAEVTKINSIILDRL